MQGPLLLLLVLLALALPAARTWRGLRPAARAAFVAAVVLATPVAAHGTTQASERLLAGLAASSDAALFAAHVAIALVLGGLVWMAHSLPWRRASWLLPLVPVALLVGATAGEGVGIEAGDARWWALTVGLLLLAALAPPALAQATQRPAWPTLAAVTPPGFALLALGLLSLVTVPMLLLGDGAPQRAEHSWRATLEPSGDEPYVVHVPFVSPTTENGEWLAERLREALRVESGEATFRLSDDGASLLVEGRGDVTLAGVVSYYGDVGRREAFNGLALVEPNVTLLAGGPASMDVAWSVDFSGGTGHTCWARETLRAAVRSGESVSILRPDGDGRAWLTACA